MKLSLAFAALFWSAATLAALNGRAAAHWCGLAIETTGAHVGHIALFAVPLPFLALLFARERSRRSLI